VFVAVFARSHPAARNRSGPKTEGLVLVLVRSVGLGHGPLGAVFSMLVLGVLVRVRVSAAIGMAMLVLVLDVLMGMGVSRAVVLVFVGMAIACFHFDFVVYK